MKSDIEQLASQCVRCAACVPHCPTYAVHPHEGQNPRGRITLAASMASGDISATERAQQHLSQCVGCRLCENVCPANVSFSHIMQLSREHTLARKHRQIFVWLLRFVQSSSKYWRWLQPLLNQLAHQLHSKSSWRYRAQLFACTPAASMPLLDDYPPNGTIQGQVALFTGCLEKSYDNNIAHLAIEQLNQHGYRVLVPRTQSCCGAMAQHMGKMQQARQLVENNLQVFNSHHIDAIITLSSGCQLTLREYPKIFSGALKAPIVDIVDFLLKTRSDDHLDDHNVLEHVPCTRYSMNCPTQQALACEQLSGQCCGAGGPQMLRFPQQAQAMGQRFWEQSSIRPQQRLITRNTGCRLHLNACRPIGFQPVLHPLEYFALKDTLSSNHAPLSD